jgi:hypothetical protein
LCPAPDTSDSFSAIHGLFKRSAVLTPVPDPAIMDQLEKFTEMFCLKFLEPLPSDSDVSVETWLAKTNYTLGRKADLLNKHEQIVDPFDYKNYNIDGFIKRERYNKYKYPRIIFSRKDKYKTLVAPIFNLIDKAVFSLPFFIKNVPHSERPKLIIDKLSQQGARYRSSDYESYEAHFKYIMFKSVGWVVYRYLTQKLPSHKAFMWYVTKVQAGYQFINMREFKMAIEDTRMSGDQDTSVGNGLYNLIGTLFLYYQNVGELAWDLKIFVEGDDGIHTILGQGITLQQYNSIGLTVKFEDSDQITNLSFCGIVMDSIDLINTTDPLEYIANFFWLDRKYYKSTPLKLASLLRAKAFSALFQYPGFPIIYPLALTVLEITGGADMKITRGMFSDNYSHAKFKNNLRMYLRNPQMYNVNIPMNTRGLVEEKYNIPIQVQLYLEDMFLIQKRLPIIFTDFAQSLFADYQQHYYNNYTFVVDVHDPTNSRSYVQCPKPHLNENSFMLQDYNERTIHQHKYNKFKSAYIAHNWEVPHLDDI